jgi:hypothetical protein
MTREYVNLNEIIFAVIKRWRLILFASIAAAIIGFIYAQFRWPVMHTMTIDVAPLNASNHSAPMIARRIDSDSWVKQLEDNLLKLGPEGQTLVSSMTRDQFLSGRTTTYSPENYPNITMIIRNGSPASIQLRFTATKKLNLSESKLLIESALKTTNEPLSEYDENLKSILAQAEKNVGDYTKERNELLASIIDLESQLTNIGIKLAPTDWHKLPASICFPEEYAGSCGTFYKDDQAFAMAHKMRASGKISEKDYGNVVRLLSELSRSNLLLQTKFSQLTEDLKLISNFQATRTQLVPSKDLTEENINWVKNSKVGPIVAAFSFLAFTLACAMSVWAYLTSLSVPKKML